MDKSIGYWIERFSGLFLGLMTIFISYKYFYSGSALATGKYYDIIIKASSSLFGFLLAILALIINGTNSKIQEMKENNSFPRLVHYHRVAVLLSFSLVICSIVIYSILESTDGTKYFIERYGNFAFTLLISIHAGISTWTAIDTLIFVGIFYKIILSGFKK